ncbi:hypothetical protein K3495_g15644, partial [Podosphaera aphanis]
MGYTGAGKRSVQSIYSDGSKASDGNSGGGYAIYQLGRVIQTNAFSLGKSKEIYDAEAYAALKGIEAARALSTTRFSKNLWLFIDNLEVAKKLTTKAATTSSQKVFTDAIEADKGWKTRTRLPHISEGEIKVRWVPSHAGIEGNELADSEAKRGAAMPYQ